MAEEEMAQPLEEVAEEAARETTERRLEEEKAPSPARVRGTPRRRGARKTREEEKMAEKRIREEEMAQKLEDLEKVSEFLVAGETTIEDEVIASIAGVAAKEVEGVDSLGTTSIRRTLAERLTGAERRARGVEVEVGKREAIVDLALNVIYGFSIPNIIIEVRRRVAARLLDLAGLVAKEINVKVVGIAFPERMPGKVE